MGRVEQAKKLIGVEVCDSQGQKVGKVKDMAIDLEAGRVAEILVTARGPAGVEERIVAVPPEFFRMEEPDSFVRVSLDKARLDAAPAFDYGKWGQSVDSARVAEVYQYFNVRPWFRAQGQHSVNHIPQPDEQLGYVRPASKLIGLPARNLMFERLGRVDDLAIDLSAGRVVEVIMTTGGFAGMGGELCAVPPQAFQYNGDHSEILLDMSKDALKAGPHFKASSRPEAEQAERIMGVYRFYKVEPWFSVEADKNAEKVRVKQTSDSPHRDN